MIRKQYNELNFRSSDEPHKTIELDIDSLPEKMYGYGDLVFKCLSRLAAENIELNASVYVYQSASCNFMDQTFSGFFCVVGSDHILQALQ